MATALNRIPALRNDSCGNPIGMQRNWVRCANTVQSRACGVAPKKKALSPSRTESAFKSLKAWERKSFWVEFTTLSKYICTGFSKSSVQKLRELAPTARRRDHAT